MGGVHSDMGLDVLISNYVTKSHMGKAGGRSMSPANLSHRLDYVTMGVFPWSP